MSAKTADAKSEVILPPPSRVTRNNRACSTCGDTDWQHRALAHRPGWEVVCCKRCSRPVGYHPYSELEGKALAKANKTKTIVDTGPKKKKRSGKEANYGGNELWG